MKKYSRPIFSPLGAIGPFQTYVPQLMSQSPLDRFYFSKFGFVYPVYNVGWSKIIKKNSYPGSGICSLLILKK